jgi:alpha-ketoglutarate-dependent taurine dioxygenase
MFFDRESTVFFTKLNNLSESALTTYCQKFGTVVRCYIKNSSQTRNKDPCKFKIILYH